MYKLAFIGGGSGSIAGTPHFIASQMDRRFCVVGGVFSHDDELSKARAKEWGVESFSNVDDMVKTLKPDAVCVLTPTPQHINDLKTLAKYDLAIICEKPLASSVEEGLYLRELLKDKFVAISNNYSGYAMLRELKAQLASKRFGKVLSLELEMPQESFLRPPKSVKYPQKWRLKDGKIPMICLDLGTHLHHLAYFVLGIEPSQVMAKFASLSHYGVVDDAELWLEYESGINATMSFSKTRLGNANSLAVKVFCEAGSLCWKQNSPEILKLCQADGTTTLLSRGAQVLVASHSRYARMTHGHPAGFIEAFANLYTDIAHSLEHWHKSQGLGIDIFGEYVYGIDHAIAGLELFDSALTSSKLRKWVEIERHF